MLIKLLKILIMTFTLFDCRHFLKYGTSLQPIQFLHPIMQAVWILVYLCCESVNVTRMSTDWRLIRWLSYLVHFKIKWVEVEGTPWNFSGTKLCFRCLVLKSWDFMKLTGLTALSLNHMYLVMGFVKEIGLHKIGRYRKNICFIVETLQSLNNFVF